MTYKVNTHMDATRTRLFIGLETADKTQKVKKENVVDYISDQISAGTFTDATGLWNGDTEESLVFECVNIKDNIREDADIDTVDELKQRLEHLFNQESVMVERADVEVKF